MYRSKSLLAEKKKKDLKSAREQNSNPNYLTKNVNQENYPHTQRPQSCREKIDERVTKIRQGFATLEKKLNWDSFNPTNSKLRPTASSMTKKKVSKKLFIYEAGKKTPSKSKQRSKKSSKKLIELLSPPNLTPKHLRYHSCFFQKSLYDLMKVVVMQRNEIERLNIEMKTHRKRGYYQKMQTK